MDQKRLFLAIAISLAIMIGFQMLISPHLPQPPATAAKRSKPELLCSLHEMHVSFFVLHDYRDRRLPDPTRLVRRFGTIICID